jgi:hypothetical protein
MIVTCILSYCYVLCKVFCMHMPTSYLLLGAHDQAKIVTCHECEEAYRKYDCYMHSMILQALKYRGAHDQARIVTCHECEQVYRKYYFYMHIIILL